jgi:hypothetical protein
MRHLSLWAIGCVLVLTPLLHGGPQTPAEQLFPGQFAWSLSPPLISPAVRNDDPCDAIKDPTIVHYGGRWHLFCTIRSHKRTHQIEYLSFTDFKDAGAAERHVLKFHDGFFCAPQVFYFEPHGKWYLIFQAADPKRTPPYGPAFSVNADVSKPQGWSRVQFLDVIKGQAKAWLDFWVICDEANAYLFFTSLDGRMWRAQTGLDKFPGGWSEPALALEADIFEASHIYRLKGRRDYLAMIEAQDGGRRYQKAYLADRLDGRWRELAASRQNPLASRGNVRQIGAARPWTDSVSHAELIRSGHDQRLEVNPADLRMIFQGVSDNERAGKAYGKIPWRLGVLTMDGAAKP